MKRYFHTVVFLLLIPVMGEIISATEFSVDIPGSPFTLGRLTFTIVGFLSFVYYRKVYFTNPFIALLFIFLGSIIGSFFSFQIETSMLRAIASIILVFASIGYVPIWNDPKFRLYIDVFFSLNLFYWCYYFYDKVYNNGFFEAYSQLFINGDVLNHHIIGLSVSLSSVYLAVRFFYVKGQMLIGGFVVLFGGLIICFIAESRSNAGIIVFLIFLILYQSKYNFKKLLMFILPIFFMIVYSLLILAESNDIIYRRFNLLDSDYQERTSGMRFDFILGFLETFKNNLLGKGLLEVTISYGPFDSTLVHNQYLTFILAGGVMAFIGVFWLFVGFFKILYVSLRESQVDPFRRAVKFTLLVFYITLLTIEFTGLLFFVNASLLMWLSKWKSVSI